VFGDHCSPISDTTIISAMASDCDVIEHTKTQLPYALIGGAVAFMLFLLVGAIG
jgi:Na+/H+ antiporter NhaC